jgi:hypothetical protein
MAIGVVANAVPVGVLPQRLARKFTRVENWLTQANRYPSGEQQAKSLVATPRWAFELECGLTAEEAAELRTFYEDHGGGMIPFYLYVPEEATPRWTIDLTGASASGRYTVHFIGAWDQTVGIGTLRVGAAIRMMQLA